MPQIMQYLINILKFEFSINMKNFLPTVVTLPVLENTETDGQPPLWNGSPWNFWDYTKFIATSA